jgi:uncharacterized membrane protein YhaH (DUF805 family)
VTTNAPSGWYPDPENQQKERWWDGESWGEQTRQISPLSQLPPPSPLSHLAPPPASDAWSASLHHAGSHSGQRAYADPGLITAPALSFGAAVRDAFRNYAVFTGRTSRSGYWYFFLFAFLGSFAAGMLDGLLLASGVLQNTPDSAFTGIASPLWQLGILLPALSALTRRLRDAGYRPRYLWLLIVPGGVLVILVLLLSKGKPGLPNKGLLDSL